MTRIVCDVSTMLHWKRPPVGIIRTEQKFLRFLLGRPDVDVAFCCYEPARRRYVEVERAVVSAALDGRAGADPVPPTDAPAANGVPPALRLRTRAWVAGLARRCIERLPASLQFDAMLVARNTDQLVRSVYWLGRRAGRAAFSSRTMNGTAAEPTMAVAEPEEPAFPFRPTDCYLSMGLDWDWNDLAALWDCKRTHGFRTVLYCYDVIPVYFPHLMSFDARQYFAGYFVNLAHCADHVVAISEATRDDYLRFLEEVGAPTPPVTVIHLGTDIQDRCEPADVGPPAAELARRPFVLCVGTIEARKNHELLYNLWDRLVAAHGERTPLLVLVGMVGWGVQDLLARLRVNPRVARRILIFDHLGDEQLLWLYRHCRFSVFPSFYEGWGLPVAESLAVGRPCIVSNVAAVREASQGLAPAIDPLDFSAWYAQVERWIRDDEALAAAAAEVRRRYVPMSWQRHGEAMLDLIGAFEPGERCASSI